MTTVLASSDADTGLGDSSARILVVDDNEAIHDDFRKVLTRAEAAASDLEAQLFGESDSDSDADVTNAMVYQIDSAHQGLEAIEETSIALGAGDPYSVVFMDVRMPPGLDGIKTTARILELDPHVQVVICTAYSDYSWAEMIGEIGETDRVLILKKPFDPVEVRQLAAALHRKWELAHAAAATVSTLEDEVRHRTAELETTNALLRKEMDDRQRLESDLRLAQKLEAVGQLAAGVAHEINTPMQFIGDNVSFLHDAFDSIAALIGEYQDMSKHLTSDITERIAKAEVDADIEFLMEDIPSALQEAASGAAAVSNIVRAMKAFSHHNSAGNKSEANINQALEDTLTISRNEYKNVAEIDLDLGELPPVVCAIGDLSQVFLNLIINAAHAIGDKDANSDKPGTIGVRTWMVDDENVGISIRDTGAGIRDEIKERIFDPFFTTKEVGRGSGQGLAISRSIVTDRHGGTITFETQVGAGTEFHIVIPVAATE